MNRLAIALMLVAAIPGAESRAAGQDRADRIVVPLSDPSRPSTLAINMYAGIVTITAVEGREIVIEATTPTGGPGRAGRGLTGRNGVVGPPSPAADPTGLTRLRQPTSLDVEESNNVVSVRGPSDGRIDLTIQAPVRTSLKLNKRAQGSNLGTITVRGLDGDLEIHTGAGTITLTDVSGSFVAHSSMGSVVATVKRVTPDRPMAFTSYSGSVDVTLPRSVKADLILGSHQGEVFTNFDVQVRNSARADSRQPGGGFRRSGNEPLRATVNGGGPELELRTFSGNVYLRKGAQ